MGVVRIELFKKKIEATKNFLIKLRDLQKKINLNKYLIETFLLKNSPKSYVFSNFREMSASKNPQKTESAMAVCNDLAALLEKIEKETKKDELFFLEGIELLKKLQDEKHKEILFLRYVKNISWKEISLRVKYSKRYVLRLHREAIIAFSKFF